MTIQELKNRDGYDFECTLSKREALKGIKKFVTFDEWGVACVWLGEDIGVEYNFCIDDDVNSSAIYKMEFDYESGYMKTDYDTFIHYEIDYNDRKWKKNLEDAMCKALIEFFDI